MPDTLQNGGRPRHEYAPCHALFSRSDPEALFGAFLAWNNSRHLLYHYGTIAFRRTPWPSILTEGRPPVDCGCRMQKISVEEMTLADEGDPSCCDSFRDL
uniref:Uncharacterized protein n=1 Tax=Corethron hystrix TaxID=216773 RepID=A0A7S1BDT2_9STRA|mmetsp:Transcript_23669/g.53989  ORF Transcript_23669/g.53989 Transcript_23669/m.53989 type:complete len:100 (+) Transcript_23669:110-409(+)